MAMISKAAHHVELMLKHVGVQLVRVFLIFLGVASPLLMTRCQMIIEERRAIRVLRNQSPELLLKASRKMIGNRSAFESHPIGLQASLAADAIWLNSSDPFWPEGVPQEIVDLKPQSVMIDRKHVEILLSRGRRSICLWAFAEGDSGKGSIQLADGLWIARRADGWGKNGSVLRE